MMSDDQQLASSSKPGLWQSLGSVGAAFFGVQSDSKRRRDFEHGKPHYFIALGVIATGAFILGIWGLVALVMSLAAT